MKNLLVLPMILLSLTFFSCSNPNDDAVEESNGILRVEEQIETRDKDVLETQDSSIRQKGGTRMPVEITQTDSLTLPNELLKVIEKTEGIDAKNIQVKRRFVEDNITYYQLDFKLNNGQKKTIIFDESGKEKSTDK